MTISSRFGGDRPIGPGNDRLGYDEAARHVANAILKFASPEGFVLGLEGRWGSGKSSFANLVVDALRTSDPAPEIVRFSPWLISSRNGLIEELFRQLAVASEKIPLASDEQAIMRKFKWFGRTTPRRAKQHRIADRLRRFSAQLERIGALANVAGVLFASIAPAGTTIERAEAAAGAWTSQPSLENEKEALTAELRRLTRQIVIFVDDLDRLEPAEAAEVVRLVRAVADFPNVTYVLCYSRKILKRSLEHAINVKDGAAYIEKIVQVEFSIPKPEDFDLRHMFREDLFAIFSPKVGEDEGIDSLQRQQRLATVIDIEGGRTFRTPRDVVHVLNALRLYAGPVLDRIDLADMVWLQLARIRNVALYAWVESYMHNVAAIASGRARMDEGETRTLLRDLKRALEKEGGDLNNRLMELRRIVPGISLPMPGDEDATALFHNLNAPEAFATLVADKRLGSPQHFKFYFALSKPSGALEDDEFRAFVTAAEHNVSDAVQVFCQWAEQRRSHGGVVVEGILDRLSADTLKALPEGALRGIIICLANGMDVAATTEGIGEWGRFWIWNSADRVLKNALDRISRASRAGVLQASFAEGKALGWLSNIMRNEIFAHGRSGKPPRDEEERSLTAEELDAVVLTMQKRYRESDPLELLKTPLFLNLLFAWLQSGKDGAAEVQSWVGRRIERDDELLTFLDHVRSWAAVNGRTIYPIKRANLTPFADYDEARARVVKLADSHDASIAARAAQILRAFEEGDDL